MDFVDLRRDADRPRSERRTQRTTRAANPGGCAGAGQHGSGSPGSIAQGYWAGLRRARADGDRPPLVS